MKSPKVYRAYARARSATAKNPDLASMRRGEVCSRIESSVCAVAKRQDRAVPRRDLPLCAAARRPGSRDLPPERPMKLTISLTDILTSHKHIHIRRPALASE